MRGVTWGHGEGEGGVRIQMASLMVESGGINVRVRAAKRRGEK